MPSVQLEVPRLPGTDIDMSSWGTAITWHPPLGNAAMTFYRTVHLLNPSTAQKQSVEAGRKDGCLPVSWQVTQFNLALKKIISTPRQDERKGCCFFPLSPLLHLLVLCLFLGKVGSVFIKAKITYMFISNKNNIDCTEVQLQCQTENSPISVSRMHPLCTSHNIELSTLLWQVIYLLFH